jgi:group II intron maturase
MAQIPAKIRERTPRGHAALPLAAVVEGLNPALRGWAELLSLGQLLA